jgi:hypothetical protein
MPRIRNGIGGFAVRGLDTPDFRRYLLRDTAEVLAVERFTEAVGSLGQLIFGQPTLMESNFLQTGDHQALAGLNGMNKGRRIKQ